MIYDMGIVKCMYNDTTKPYIPKMIELGSSIQTIENVPAPPVRRIF